MARPYPARGSLEWDTPLKQYIDGGVSEAESVAWQVRDQAVAAKAAAEAARTAAEEAAGEVANTAESIEDALASVEEARDAIWTRLDRVTQETVSGNYYVVDLGQYDTFDLTLTQNTTLDIDGLLPGRVFVVIVHQGSTGGRTFTTTTPVRNAYEQPTDAGTYTEYVFYNVTPGNLRVRVGTPQTLAGGQG